MRHHSIGPQTRSLLSRVGLRVTVKNRTQSTPLPNEPSDGFDEPDVTETTVQTDAHLSRLNDPYIVRDSSGEQSQAVVTIYLPTDVLVTDGDEDIATTATRITVNDSGRTYRVVDVHEYGDELVRTMCTEE